MKIYSFFFTVTIQYHTITVNIILSTGNPLLQTGTWETRCISVPTGDRVMQETSAAVMARGDLDQRDEALGCRIY